MPRSFLITHRRYNSEDKDFKELKSQLTNKMDSTDRLEVNSNCPEEFYNLTKLAEVALATGQILEHKKFLTTSKSTTSKDEPTTFTTYTHKLFDKSSRTPRPHLIKTEEFKCPVVEMDIQENNVTSNPNENNEHECGDCGKRYSTSSNLARHRQTHRSPADKKARRCPHCDKLYVSMPAFSMHVRTHNQGCKCHYCGKCFSRPWLLQGHIRTHTGEKPFKCSICSKAFADKSNLRAHIQTHSNTKPHICGRCGKAFALKSYLYKHEESSCMRLNGRHSSRETTPDKNISSPTPVIVNRIGDSVIKSPDYQLQNPMIYRSTVISPNPERILYSTIQHPSVILKTTTGRYGSNSFGQLLQDQPMDFSSQNRKEYQNNEHTTGYAIGLAIAV